MKNAYYDIDGYIQTFPKETQKLLKRIRTAIRKASPGAEEGISYGMPVFKINGKPLVYFAAFKDHIGFYALPTGHSEFADELVKYKHGKGSVQFPLDNSLPLDLIRRITQFRVWEILGTIPNDPKHR
jgi:uncharacterized protein YdhG (YjbR/CyaY superfamily)